MNSAPKLKTKGVEAVDKALRILSLFDSRSPTLSLGEISERSGLVKSSALRLLISLQNAGYITMTTDKRYAVGVEAFRIGQVYQHSLRLEEVIRPVLEDLVRKTGESGSFFRREGNMRVCLFRADTHQPLREHVAEGDAVEIGKGAAGHVFMTYGALAGDVPAGADDLARLPDVSIGERGPGIAGMSAPIFAVGQGMIGALSLSGPSLRLTEERITEMKPHVLAAAATICTRLGSPFYDAAGGGEAQ
ncbi:IclR family transcriptional regulator [Salipiger abyssi]|uniref:Transcriptional regulator n=1 Tax=Salipiger abyssi TaxID=1250539 RepID=A0A1P8US95_9RHOB|nr:IclR family transcriptional regulator [Salipiger abyssi]APZ52206.1 transcriptional regulator [Salipiger abyssi]